jgi:ATP-binding cassette subfamily F protein uup
MPLVTLRNIQLSYGGPLLLEDVSLVIEPGERICLIGRNGEGKSTLMKVIEGSVIAESGEREIQQGARITRLEQEVPEGGDKTIFQVVAEGLGHIGSLIQSYHDASQRMIENPDEKAMDLLARAQHELEAVDGWQLEQRVEKTLSRLSLDPETRFSALSGGMKRRVLLAQAIVQEPDLLLLDEPTNHLDLEAIQWLEEFLVGWKGSLLFVTHDRAFLKKLATRIVELDRGRITDWPGNYENYLRRREERLNAEQKANERFDKKLAEEEVWIRQGIKARRTRNEGRVRALKSMREERMQRRVQQGTANIRLQESERSGKLIVEAKNISYAWDDRPIVSSLSTTILRGDRIGIIGPNGAGKTTLLKLLLGKLAPDSGEIRLGQGLQVAYFDQLRTTLDENKSVADNVADGHDKVVINGQSKHIYSYLQDFLFTPDRARQPVRSLSGGERNRLLLARLFARPANVLVMDEPTNDLDIETLELLEEVLIDYAGTLLLVSHDRDFLNNVVSSTLVFEGEGDIGEYIGGYDDWIRQRPEVSRKQTTTGEDKKPAAAKASTAPARKKLSYKDQRELEQLPQKIESLEHVIEALQSRMADPSFYQENRETIASTQEELAQTEEELAQCYERWEALEEQTD